MWIFKISREINFGYSISAKCAILTHLEAMNFDFYEFLHFLIAEIYQINTKFRAPKVLKIAFSKVLDSPELISRKI